MKLRTTEVHNFQKNSDKKKINMYDVAMYIMYILLRLNENIFVHKS